MVINRIKDEEGGFGYNAKNDTYEDLFAAGIIDPKKVTRLALENAASIAGLLLTTECMIADEPEESAGAGAGAHGHGGGTVSYTHLDVYKRQAVGPGKKDEPLTVKVGDTILYGKYAGTEIAVEGQEYLIMRESDIFAII